VTKKLVKILFYIWYTGMCLDNESLKLILIYKIQNANLWNL